MSKQQFAFCIFKWKGFNYFTFSTSNGFGHLYCWCTSLVDDLESAVNWSPDRSRKAISRFFWKLGRSRDFQPRFIQRIPRKRRERALVIVVSRVAGLFQRRKYNLCNCKYFPLEMPLHSYSIVEGIQEIHMRKRSQRAIFTGNCRKQCSAQIISKSF